MFGIGETELLIIVAFGFMIFGPDKLPGMGRTIGRALRQFRQAQEGFTEVVQTEVMDPLQEAMGDPLDNGTRKKRRATAEERAAAMAQDADIDAPEARGTRAQGELRRAQGPPGRRAQGARGAEEAAAAQAAEADRTPSLEELPRLTEPSRASEEPVEEPEAPDTSAAALYAMGGRSSFRAAKEQPLPEARAEGRREGRSRGAAKAESPLEPDPRRADTDAADTTDGEEAGSDEA